MQAVDVELAHEKSATDEWRNGWPTVLAAIFGTGLSVAHVYSLGLFAAPLEKEFGWTRTQVYSGVSFGIPAAVLLIPVAGFIVDRVGARRVVLFGVPVFGIAFAALSTSGFSLWGWLANWLLLAVSSAFAGSTIWSAAVSRRFNASRGLALAVALSGTSLIQIVMPPLALTLIDRYSWRDAYAILGLGITFFITPLVFVCFETPGSGASDSRSAKRKIDWRQFRNEQLLKLGAAAFFVTGGLAAIANQFVPIITHGGLSRATAAGAAGLLGFGSLIGRVTTGALLDRLRPRLVACLIFALPLAPCALIVSLGASNLSSLPASPFVIASFLGLAYGAEVDIFAFFVARYFGTVDYGILFGTVVAVMSLGVSAGSFLLAKTFDITGTYDLGVWLIMPAFILSSLLILFLGPHARNASNP